MKIIHIVGNRPQFIKLFPFLKATENRDIDNVIVHSGQHYDYSMSDIFFNQLEIPEPKYNLETGSGTHGFQTGTILKKLDPILINEKPDVVVVYGDTNTTLAGALGAYKLHTKVAHVESGMRENIWRPEEMNKKVADHCSDYCFCPLQRASDNLLMEGIPEEKIFNTGDITYDAFRYCSELSKSLAKVEVPEQEYVLFTMHRAETVDCFERVEGIIEAMIRMPVNIIYPIHPRTKQKLNDFGLYNSLLKANNVTLFDPLGYFEFNKMLLNAKMVVTDSSGVLKEAYYARKLCVTIDNTTEYREIFDEGCNVLAGMDTGRILSEVDEMLKREFIAPEFNPFGNGRAAEKMVSILER